MGRGGVSLELGPLGTIAAVILVIGIIGVLLIGLGNLINVGSSIPRFATAAGQAISAGWAFIVLAAALAIIVIVFAISRDRGR